MDHVYANLALEECDEFQTGERINHWPVDDHAWDHTRQTVSPTVFLRGLLNEMIQL